MMASLPSLTVGGTLHKPPPTSLPVEKTLSYQRGPPAPDSHSEQPLVRPLEAHEALSILGAAAARIDSAVYVPLLHQCTARKSLPAAAALHAHILKTGTQADVFVCTSLVNAYMKCGAAAQARKLFDASPRRNVVTWTALVTGYVHNAQPELALQVFVDLLGSGRFPTNYTLGAALGACCALRAAELGEQIHAYVIKYSLERDTSIGNSLCSLYAKCGALNSAVKAFRRTSDKNVISWTTLISACGDNVNVSLGIEMFVEMLSESVTPNEFTLTSALSLCSAVSALLLGKQLHSMCLKLGFESNLPVKNSIMYLYLKCGEIDEARRVFDSMETVSLITWNAMIAGHAQMMDLAKDDISSRRSGMEALKMFQKLNRSSMKPDLFTLSSILTVCSGLVAAEQGEQIHAQAIKTGFLSDVVVSSSLVNMYNKCGCIEKASKAFVEMPTRTLISWTSMLTGYSQHGRSKEAIQLFEDMRMAGVKPNHVTFVGVLSACSHAGMVDEAQHYFELMKNEYGIKPVMDHYACMIDMYVRLGRLEDAFEFINRMKFEPNEVIWSILIAGCRSHGKIELAFYAAEKLLELRPKSVETYVLLMNMYISTERWHDVARVRKMMKDENVGSVRDRSWINIKDKSYFFKADDRSHSQSAKMYELLEELLNRAQGLGYVPYKSVEVSDEGGEERHSSTMLHHSERLAIAFGLLNLPKGMPVRVVKNISMCRDCHSAIKYFSMLTQREIIVRDSKRLHKFRDGQCSCGDFGAIL